MAFGVTKIASYLIYYGKLSLLYPFIFKDVILIITV